MSSRVLSGDSITRRFRQ